MDYKVLVVVDMQNDFVTGSLANTAAQAIIPNIKNQIQSGNYDCKVFTQDTHQKNYLNSLEGKNLPIPHCITGTWGHEIVPDLISGLSEFDDYITLEKDTFGWNGDWARVFAGFTPYISHVVEPTEITLVGTCTDICVVSNALAMKAQFPEAKVRVIANCCAGLTPEKHEAALEVMRSCQIEVI